MLRYRTTLPLFYFLIADINFGPSQSGWFGFSQICEKFVLAVTYSDAVISIYIYGCRELISLHLMSVDKFTALALLAQPAGFASRIHAIKQVTMY